MNEVRRQDGYHYPPRSIHQLLSGLQRHMLEVDNMAPKFLDRSKSEFRPIQGACDSVFHKLHSGGIGTSVCHTATAEEKLWSSDVFSCDNPKEMQRTVFYYIGK